MKFLLFFSLLWRAQRAPGSVGFFTKGSTRVFWPRNVSQKFPFFSQKFPFFSQKFPFFSQNVQMAKKRANTKVNGKMPKKIKISQNFSKVSIFFSKVSIFFSKVSIFFSKVSICFSNVSIFFSKVAICVSKVSSVFSKVSICFSKGSSFFSKSSIFLKIFHWFLKKNLKKSPTSSKKIWANPENVLNKNQTFS